MFSVPRPENGWVPAPAYAPSTCRFFAMLLSHCSVAIFQIPSGSAMILSPGKASDPSLPFGAYCSQVREENAKLPSGSVNVMAILAGPPVLAPLS